MHAKESGLSLEDNFCIEGLAYRMTTVKYLGIDRVALGLCTKGQS